MYEMSEEKFIHAAYTALSRRCKFKRFKFLHFSSHDTAFGQHILVANFMHEKTEDVNWMFVYEQTPACNQWLEIPEKLVGVLDEDEVVKVFMGIDSHDVFIDSVIPHLKTGDLEETREDLLIWSKTDSFEKLLVEDDLNTAC